MTKLFISCATMEAGGAERVISVLSESFAVHYDEVRILMWVDAPVFYNVDPRVRLVSIEKESGTKNIISKMCWFRHYISHESPNLILSFLYPWSMKVLIALSFIKTNVVVAERQDPRIVRGGRVTKVLRNLLYLKAKGIIVQTRENRNYYASFIRRKIKAIYNPVNIPLNMKGMALRKEKDGTIVSVGRLSVEKNHELLIRAFSLFLQDHPSFVLKIYGEGKQRTVLQKLIDEMHMEDKVLLMGNSNNVLEDIISSDVFVLSSDYEGMPNALIEAMCLGIPCISTRVSGASELIRDGENGILIDVRSIDQMAHSMSMLVDNRVLSEHLAGQAVAMYDFLRVEVIQKNWTEYLDSIIFSN